ncbi:MAG: putative lipase [Saprospiraceae bacterium]|nr:putative lipase [Saprospiraceae bacterium]
MKNNIQMILFGGLFLMSTVLHSQTVCPESQRSTTFSTPEVSEYPPEFGPPVNPPTPGFSAPEDTLRQVFFLHGLGGSSESWAKIRTATEAGASGFPGRKVIANNLDYNGYLGDLAGAATHVYNLVDDLVEDQDSFQRTRNYFIAHSQGGLVSRRTDKRMEDLGHAFSKDFGGIVTFGSPHQGAYIGNSLMDVIEGDETRIQKWLYDGCRKVGAAVIHDKIDIPINLPIVGINLGTIKVEHLTDVSNLTDSLCGVVDLLFQIVPNFAALAKPILDDYKDGGSQISVLNSHDANSPNPVQKVAFYGIKGDKDQNGDPQSIFWRTAQWFLVDPSDIPIFQANADHQVEASIKDWITNFEANAYFAGFLYGHYKQKHESSWGLNHKAWQNKVAYRDVRDDSRAAAKWLKEADRTWSELIGARVIEDGIVESCYCR